VSLRSLRVQIGLTEKAQTIDVIQVASPNLNTDRMLKEISVENIQTVGGMNTGKIANLIRAI
jgi:hypothetical protein